MNFLFVCSKNKWRSRTAESIFQHLGNHKVRSAGTENTARIKVNESLIKWSDIIFVMEEKHKSKLKKKFDVIINHKKIIVLDIPDEYKFMDEELIEILESSLQPYL